MGGGYFSALALLAARGSPNVDPSIDLETLLGKERDCSQSMNTPDSAGKINANW